MVQVLNLTLRALVRNVQVLLQKEQQLQKHSAHSAFQAARLPSLGESAKFGEQAAQPDYWLLLPQAHHCHCRCQAQKALAGFLALPTPRPATTASRVAPCHCDSREHSLSAKNGCGETCIHGPCRSEYKVVHVSWQLPSLQPDVDCGVPCAAPFFRQGKKSLDRASTNRMQQYQIYFETCPRSRRPSARQLHSSR